jgi:hypothetical protein
MRGQLPKINNLVTETPHFTQCHTSWCLNSLQTHYIAICSKTYAMNAQPHSAESCNFDVTFCCYICDDRAEMAIRLGRHALGQADIGRLYSTMRTPMMRTPTVYRLIVLECNNQPGACPAAIPRGGRWPKK